MTATDAGQGRFESGANEYAAYLDTPEGRLRTDLTFANLLEFLRLPQAGRHLCALDLGCGTGAIAVRLARPGVHVTLLDAAPAMLDVARRAAQEAGVAGQVSFKQGDAADAATLLRAESFDVILCHNVLEYVADPGAVLRAAARLMNGESAIMSILVRNQAGEVFKAGIQKGDLGAAEGYLTSECGREALFGGPVRLFTSESLHSMLDLASLAVTAERGVRVISDYLPASVSRAGEYDRILELERKLGRRLEFARVARYLNYLAQRAKPLIEDGQ